MSASNNTKESGIDLRLSQEQKKTLEKAAALMGLSVSSYVLSHSLAAANKDIATHETLVLSERDRDLFLSLLENPPKPCEALKSAMQEYQDQYEKR